MISDERLNELEQVEGLADLVAEVRRLRLVGQLPIELVVDEKMAPGTARLESSGDFVAIRGLEWTIDTWKAARRSERDHIANQVEEKVGPVFGPTLAKMIRELPEE